MKTLSPTTKKVFLSLFANLNRIGAEKKYQKGTAFMPLRVMRTGLDLFEVWHSYTQNGDTMMDPLVTFWVSPSGEIVPVLFRQDNLGQNRFCVDLEQNPDGTHRAVRYRPKTQRDLACFCTVWARNLKFQQDLSRGGVLI